MSRRVIVAIAVTVAALAGIVANESRSSSAASITAAPRGEPPKVLGPTDGLVPGGTSVFDDATPAVANLDPQLLTALRRAATDAARNGVTFHVNSGWRSAAYQQQLLRDAVLEYGSEAKAKRWVSTPSTSQHVAGRAVDIGPPRAAAWLSTHGASYGLCQIYRNEPWHYELRLGGCPRMYADPTYDPRMRARSVRRAARSHGQ